MVRRYVLLGLCIFLPIAVYAQSLGNGFVTWDDGLLITENPIIRGLSLHNLWLAFTSYDPELYIPLTFLSYQINYVIGGLQPFGYHVGNLLLHVANGVLIYKIIGRLLEAASANRSGGSRTSATVGALAAFLFAVHPLHTEAVVWAAARKDVLSAFFFLLTVYLYLQSRFDTRRCVMVSSPEPSEGRIEPGSAALLSVTQDWNRMYWWSVLMFLFALLSKVSVITWPVLMVLMDWYLNVPHASRRAAGMKIFKRTLPFAILSIIFGIIALGGKIANTGFLWEKFLMGCRAITLLLQKFFWPTHLSALYPFTKPISLLTPELGLSVLFVAFVSAIVFWLAWKRGVRLPLFVWGWFLLLLAPSFSNITKGHNELLDIYVTSDRYAYLPSVGGLLVAGWLIEKLAKRFPGIVASSAIAVVLVLAVLSYKQSLVWKDTFTLFTHVSAVQPRAYVAWSNIGTEEVRKGRLNEGLRAYAKALQIRDDATTWYNVGQILRAQGKREMAMEAYERAVASSPLEVDAKRALEELRGKN